MTAAATDLLFDGPENARLTVVLAHGAGAPMNTPFLNTVARGLAADGYRVARFEFPYMRARRETGRKGGAPDREPVLRNSWKDVVTELGGGERLVIGGKSMGGRIASMVADEVGARGLVCLGYPFHPPGRPERKAKGSLRRRQGARPSAVRWWRGLPPSPVRERSTATPRAARAVATRACPSPACHVDCPERQ